MATTDSEALHPDAPHHLPFFITAPGDSDSLMVLTGLFLLAAVVGIGVLYFKLHALPEQMAHRGQKVQFELVAVLALLALFTHNHTFWVAGLLLALLPLPDFTTPLRTIARSLERIADQPPAGANHVEPSVAATSSHATPAAASESIASDPEPPAPAANATPPLGAMPGTTDTRQDGS
jgi:hypothetical protein